MKVSILLHTFLAGFFFSILDPDQAQENVSPELDPNCLPKLSAEATTRESIYKVFFNTDYPLMQVKNILLPLEHSAILMA